MVRHSGLGNIQFVDDIVHAHHLTTTQGHDLLAGSIRKSFSKIYRINNYFDSFHIDRYLCDKYNNRSLSICQAPYLCPFQNIPVMKEPDQEPLFILEIDNGIMPPRRNLC